MSTPNEKLTTSLDLLNAVQQDGIVGSSDLTRTHPERLVRSGFLSIGPFATFVREEMQAPAANASVTAIGTAITRTGSPTS